MKYMREKHPDVSKQQYQLSLVTPLENENKEQDDEAPESEDTLLGSILCK